MFYGVLAMFLVLGLAVAVLLARRDVQGPGLFSQDQAIMGLALSLLVVVLILIILLVRMATLHRQMREIREVHERMVRLEPAPSAEVAGGSGGDVIDIEGIGPVYAKRLHEVGLPTIGQLVAADAGTVANSIGVEAGLVREWQAMGRLIRLRGIGPQYAEVLVRAGVRTPAALAKAKAAPLAKKINKMAAERKVRLTGAAIQAGRVQGWITAAKHKDYDR
jgi:predicted flap endonuclease-1-like 5' DNA nuclease